ncbi:hypothetical protein EDEG_00208 [Edhazardia aedis USNM 41457]|uniref:Uncharacterized protein n=1 Tax=Edhazardia aedis (strain USNM 41457) TaxID=1003232 RepID=J8ZUM7_EDHAE|nr:hypothetical protein EDEG_00208 [Edhazardia aedis USNM 41457]|eukprot:EJW03383.1 hypothetical protein EDEG_00208 [Edhazardia aedis USNM 41457]
MLRLVTVCFRLSSYYVEFYLFMIMFLRTFMSVINVYYKNFYNFYNFFIYLIIESFSIKNYNNNVFLLKHMLREILFYIFPITIFYFLIFFIITNIIAMIMVSGLL